MEKVTVPKEVAEAIENARRRGASDFVILNRAVNGVVTVSNEIIRKWAFGQDGGSPDLLMRAIVNGYEIEKSPEEKLRNIFEEYRANYRSTEDWERDNGYA